MDPILIFLVLPIAIIILAIVLQRILKCPILVALTFFAIFLILTFTVFGTDFLIFAILYTILAFIAAFLAELFCRIARRLRNWDDNNLCSCGRRRNCECDDEENCFRSGGRSGRSRNNGCGCNCNNDSDNGNLLTITSSCGNGESTELLAINSNGNNNGNNCNNNSCNCGNNLNNSESIVLNAEVVPNSSGRSGCFRGNFRRCRF